ncbi:MAG: isoprenyl transferase [Bacteroidota bacterium]
MSWSDELVSSDIEHMRQMLRGSQRLPRHVAAIMDGNGRWAELRSMPRFEGHRAGMESVRSVVKACSQVGVQYLTLYAFSIENWKRPAPEVRFLMSLLESYLKKELEELHENNVRIRTIGKTNALPRGVEKVLQRAIERTSGNDGLTLTLALSYGARWDIQRAMQVIALDVRRGKLSPEDLTETTISEYLQTSYMPDPDLIIRTSGEIRLSNFLLWEAAYAELFVTDTLWPDFRDVDLYNALLDFTQRERRFGKTSAQLNTAVKTKPSTMERLRNALK